MATAEEARPLSRATEALVEAPGAVAEKAEMPAFLEGDEVPKGYKVVELGPEDSLLVSVGLTPGSEVVCYAGNLGVKLTRGKEGRIYFRLAGLDLPKDIFPDTFPDDVPILTDLGPEGIPLGLKVRGVHLFDGRRDVLEAVGSQSLVLVNVPGKVQLGGKTAGTMVLSGLPTVSGLGFNIRIGGKGVRIYIFSRVYGDRHKVVVPTAAVLERAAAGGEDE